MADNINTGDYKGIWCVAEVRRGQIHSSLYELITLGRRWSQETSEDLCCVVVGSGITAAAKALSVYGAKRVYVVDAAGLANYTDDAYSRVLVELVKKHKPSKVFMPGTTVGRSWAARVTVTFGTR